MSETEGLDYIHQAAFEGSDGEEESARVHRAITNAIFAAREATGLAVYRLQATRVSAGPPRLLWIVLVIGHAPTSQDPLLDVTIRRWLAHGRAAPLGEFFGPEQWATLLERRRRGLLTSQIMGAPTSSSRTFENAPRLRPDGTIVDPPRPDRSTPTA